MLTANIVTILVISDGLDLQSVAMFAALAVPLLISY